MHSKCFGSVLCTHEIVPVLMFARHANEKYTSKRNQPAIICSIYMMKKQKEAIAAAPAAMPMWNTVCSLPFLPASRWSQARKMIGSISFLFLEMAAHARKIQTTAIMHQLISCTWYFDCTNARAQQKHPQKHRTALHCMSNCSTFQFRWFRKDACFLFKHIDLMHSFVQCIHIAWWINLNKTEEKNGANNTDANQMQLYRNDQWAGRNQNCKIISSLHQICICSMKIIIEILHRRRDPMDFAWIFNKKMKRITEWRWLFAASSTACIWH